MPGGRPKSPYSQAHRLLKLVDMLQHRRHVTIADLMHEFGIDRRTVQRDIGVLNELYAIEEGERTAQNEKTFRLKAAARADTLRLTLLEMIALYMGRNLFHFTDGTELKTAMDSLYDKLQARLVTRNVAVRDKLPRKLYCTAGFPKSYEAKDDILNDVMTGLVDEKKVAITYQIPGRTPYPDIIHPYTLVLHNNALYVVCMSERAGARRVLALERIQTSKWRAQGEFDYPDDYDPTAELGSAFGITTHREATRVRLLFNAGVAPYVSSRRWHPSMKTKARRDGSVEVTLEVSVGEELLHWLTGYGGTVRVLSPASLRQTLHERHAAGLEASES